MTNTFVALLRGINVGGNSKVNMSELKTCFEELGFKNVRTYINSGNVIFEDKKKSVDAKKIEASLKKHFGFDLRVIVRTRAEIASVLAKVPKNWTNDTKMRTDVIFLWEEVDNSSVTEEIETNPDVDHLIYAKGAVIWNFDRKNYSKSRMHKFIGTHIYKNMTARNINTVRKLDSLMVV